MTTTEVLLNEENPEQPEPTICALPKRAFAESPTPAANRLPSLDYRDDACSGDPSADRAL